jgi:hypothetical protein
MKGHAKMNDKLTQEELNKLENASTDSEWNKICDEI